MLGLGYLLSVKVMTVRIRQAETSKPSLALRFLDCIQTSHRHSKQSFSPLNKDREVAFTPVLASNRSLIPGWKAKHVCGKAKQACEAKQNEKHFIAVLDARGGWVDVWVFCCFFFNDFKRHLKKSYSFGSSKMQLLLQVLTLTSS